MKLLILIIVCFFVQAAYSQQWTANYNNSFSDYSVGAATDINGNVYIAAQSEEGDLRSDIVTIKYSSTGAQQWVQRYQNTNPDFGVFPFDIKCSGSAIYICGYTLDQDTAFGRQLLIKYNDIGAQQWVKILNNTTISTPKMECDEGGNVLMAIKGLDTVTVIKFDAAGNQQWIYKSPAFETEFLDIETDGSGNIFLLGEAVDCVTEKLSPSGSMLWRKTYDISAEPERGYALSADNGGNLIVTGQVYENFSTYKVFTLKYSPLGDTLWTRMFTIPNHALESNGIVTDSAGNIWVAFDDEEENSLHSIGVIKYTASGTHLWNSVYAGINSDIIITHISLHNLGRIAVAGMAFGSFSDMLLLSFDENGNPEEIYSSGTSSVNEYTGGLAVNRNGDVFLTGVVDDGGNYNVVTHGFTNTIGIHPIEGEVPSGFKLKQNYPNPFNPATNIEFSIPSEGTRRSAFVQVKVFDLLGRQVAILVNENLTAGTYKASFDAASLASGTYFYRLTSGDFTDVKKMVLIK